MKVKVRIKETNKQLTQSMIQEAVCAGILQAEEQREEIAKEKIRSTKLSAWTIVKIIFYGIVAVFFGLLAIGVVVTNSKDIAKGFTSASPFFAVTLTYVIVAITEYALTKNKDKTFGFNVISIMLALGSLIVAIFC